MLKEMQQELCSISLMLVCVVCNHFGHVMLRLCPLAANRISIVGEGGVPYLVQLLESQDEDIQFYCSATLSNIAVDGGRS